MSTVLEIEIYRYRDRDMHIPNNAIAIHTIYKLSVEIQNLTCRMVLETLI